MAIRCLRLQFDNLQGSDAMQGSYHSGDPSYLTETSLLGAASEAFRYYTHTVTNMPSHVLMVRRNPYQTALDCATSLGALSPKRMTFPSI